MKILYLKIKNYRQLNNAEISFDPYINYFVGKNNIGKTNALHLINNILNRKNFKESDFANQYNKLIVYLKVQIDNFERGIFNDNFDPNNKNVLDLVFIQQSPEDNLKAFYADKNGEASNQSVYINSIKKFNYINYSSNRKPAINNTLNNKGHYFITKLVDRYLSSSKKEIKLGNSEGLIKELNIIMNKLKVFKNNELKFGFSNETIDQIMRSLIIKDNNSMPFSNLGFGTQFSTYIIMFILDKIARLDKYNKLDEYIITKDEGDKRGMKKLNVILGLDEPELHLHPNLQKLLINDLKKLIMGKDEQFNEVLKEIFGIDTINGQLIVVTHSPNILGNNFSQISRFYNNGISTKIKSGKNIKLTYSEKKQLEIHFMYFKNALFANGIIIVEGYTEMGAIPVFSDTIGSSLIKYNIDVINAHGIKSIDNLRKLFKHFAIDSVLIKDSDNKRKDTLDKRKNHLFITKFKDFEEECINNMNLFELNKYIAQFTENINTRIDYCKFWYSYRDILNLHPKDMEQNCNYDQKKNIITNKILHLQDSEKIKIYDDMYNTILKNYMRNNKSSINGRMIAKSIKKEDIPEIYSSSIKNVVKLVGDDKR